MIEDASTAGVDKINNQIARENLRVDVINKSNDARIALSEKLEISGRKQELADAAVLKALSNVRLSITIDEAADVPVIKIMDSESGEEIMQIPAEHSLNISRSIKAAVGSIYDKSA